MVDKSRLGKLFKAGGRNGYWLAISMTLRGDGCICLGLDETGEIVSSSTFNTSYIDRKETIKTLNLSEVRLEV